MRDTLGLGRAVVRASHRTGERLLNTVRAVRAVRRVSETGRSRCRQARNCGAGVERRTDCDAAGDLATRRLVTDGGSTRDGDAASDDDGAEWDSDRDDADVESDGVDDGDGAVGGEAVGDGGLKKDRGDVDAGAGGESAGESDDDGPDGDVVAGDEAGEVESGSRGDGVEGDVPRGSAGDSGGEVELPSLTPSVREFVRADRNNECEVCGADGDADDVDLTIHHRTPRSRGGTDHPHNLLLVCTSCHGRHHWNLESAKAAREAQERARGTPGSAGEADVDADTDADGDEPLPPRSEPNETDAEILSIIEAQGPVPTGVIAEQVGCSGVYARRQCWKLSGEQLITRTVDGTWELRERADPGEITIGLPDDPERARRAGRDEVIRRMSAHGLPHTEIAEITGLSRSTVDVAVNRARALRIDDGDDTDVDLQTIALRVSALLDVIEHAQAGVEVVDAARG